MRSHLSDVFSAANLDQVRDILGAQHIILRLVKNVGYEQNTYVDLFVKLYFVVK